MRWRNIVGKMRRFGTSFRSRPHACCNELVSHFINPEEIERVCRNVVSSLQYYAAPCFERTTVSLWRKPWITDLLKLTKVFGLQRP